jgi:hypothetical protein
MVFVKDEEKQNPNGNFSMQNDEKKQKSSTAKWKSGKSTFYNEMPDQKMKNNLYVAERIIVFAAPRSHEYLPVFVVACLLAHGEIISDLRDVFFFASSFFISTFIIFCEGFVFLLPNPLC